MKQVALFDFDNTIYKGYSVFDVLQAQEDGFIQKGVWSEVEEYLVQYKKGEIPYKEAANKILTSWARGLKGKTYESALDYVRSFFDSHSDAFFPWFVEIIPNLLKSHDVFIITTNFQFIAEIVVERYNLKGYIASEAEVVNGILTGSVGKSLAGGKGEVAALLEKYTNKNSIAVGDSENDINMLEHVEIPICFQPDDKLSQAAKERKWNIVDENTIISKFEEIL